MLGDVTELLIYHQPGVKPSLTLRPFGVLGYVAGHSLTAVTYKREVKKPACRASQIQVVHSLAVLVLILTRPIT